MISGVYISLLSILIWTLHGVSALDCLAKQLAKYNFESIKGVHAVSSVRDTPPSQTNLTFYFGICESLDSVEKCPKNVDVCGITSINLKDSSSPIISEIFAFNSNLQKKYNEIDEEDKKGIEITYSGANWGENLINAKLTFICDKDESKDKPNQFDIISWDREELVATLRTKAACITSEKDKVPDNKKDKDNKEKEDHGESWGWFTWTFIFFVLFISIYIIGGAWFQFSKGNAIDFQTALKEVLENFVDLLKGLPNFIKEIIEKFTGNSNRGEYSAV